MNWSRLTGAIGTLLSVAIFVGALYVLYRALDKYELTDVLARLGEIGGGAVMVGLAATAGSYVALSGFDWLALHHLRRRLPYRRVLLASFTSHAVSHSAGFGALTGGAIRYRIYSAAGLSVLEVAGVVLFSGVTFALGALTLGALALVVEPGVVAVPAGTDEGWVRWLGLATVGIVFSYVAVGRFQRSPLRLFGRSLVLPRPRVAAAQLVIAGLDLCLASAALFALLPAEAAISYPGFVGVYVLANLMGVLAHVPGGLGVFETAVIVMVPGAPADAMLGALLAFRGIYFLLPLTLGAILLGAHEALLRGRFLRRATASAGLWARAALPSVMAVAAFAAGALLFYSAIIGVEGATAPPVAALAEAAHLAAGLAGVSLVICSRGLHRRLSSAYRWAVILLVIGDVALVAMGERHVFAVVLAALAATLTVARGAFYRATSLCALGLSGSWAGAVAVAICGGVWLLMLSINNGGDLAVFEGEDRSVRVVLAGAAWGLVAIVALLNAGGRSRTAAAGAAASIVGRATAAAAPLALLPGVRHVFDKSGQALIAYVPRGLDWIAIGEPVGPPELWPDLAWEFREQAEHAGTRPVFWNVRARPLYHDLGLALSLTGEMGIVQLRGFDLTTEKYAHLRDSLRGAAHDDVAFELTALDRGLSQEVRALSEDWWSSQSPGQGDGGLAEGDYSGLRLATLRRRGRLIACAQVWAGADGVELSADLVRWCPAMGTVAREWLLGELMLWGRTNGFERFELALVPTGEDPFDIRGKLGVLAAYACHQALRPPGVRDLRSWMHAFHPEWRPRYFAIPAELGLSSPGGVSEFSH